VASVSLRKNLPLSVEGIMKCVFFDRDGIVNDSPGPGYVERWEDFHLQAGFVEVLKVVKDAGYEAIVVTNQRGVARGMISIDVVEDMHGRLRELLDKEHGLSLLDIRCCPHGNDECECRKPKPGMLLDAANQHGIDLSESWMIGDNETDIEAGSSAGCRTVRVSPDRPDTRADFAVSDMAELKSLVEKEL
jgi:D-glycero-D-manno-heptose 1,7-bisphosphate phosphatase